METTVQTIEENTYFFIGNIKELLALRPENNFKYSQARNGGVITQSTNEKDGEMDVVVPRLIALNSAILINCFSLLEGCLEWLLLKELDTYNLKGVKEKVMLKYIDDIIKLSSLYRYKEEYKFITGHPLKNLFNDKEYKNFEMIERFYVLRNLLVHGSAIKRKMVKQNIGARIILDENDLEYQKFVCLIKEKCNLDIFPENLTLSHILQRNEIIEFIMSTILSIANKIYPSHKAKMVNIDYKSFFN